LSKSFSSPLARRQNSRRTRVSQSNVSADSFEFCWSTGKIPEQEYSISICWILGSPVRYQQPFKGRGWITAIGKNSEGLSNLSPRRFLDTLRVAQSSGFGKVYVGFKSRQDPSKHFSSAFYITRNVICTPHKRCGSIASCEMTVHFPNIGRSA